VLTVNGFPLTVDATSLTAQQVQVPGVVAWDSSTPKPLGLGPGSYSFYTAGGYVLGASGSASTLSVKNDGTVSSDSSLSNIYSLVTTAHDTTLTINGVSLTVDATSLTPQQVQVPGVVAWDCSTPKPLGLAPGSYSFYTAGGYVLGASGSASTLSVKYDRTVSSDPSLSNIYSLVSTPHNATLTIAGVSLMVDATFLTPQQVQVPGVVAWDSSAPKPLGLAPGSYSFYTAGGYILGAGGSAMTLSVKNDRTVSSDPSLSHIYSLVSTAQNTTLTITGISLMVDATLLTPQQVQVPGVVAWDSSMPKRLGLAPGWYSVYSPGGYVTGANNTANVVQITNDLTFHYDATLEGPFKTDVMPNTLDLKGREIDINATAHPGQLYAVEGVGAFFDGSMIHPVQLLPGSYTIYASSTGPLGAVTVQTGGTIVFDASLNGVFAGNGTNTVIVR
jgi:hypothetical protein